MNAEISSIWINQIPSLKKWHITIWISTCRVDLVCIYIKKKETSSNGEVFTCNWNLVVVLQSRSHLEFYAYVRVPKSVTETLRTPRANCVNFYL